MLWPSIVKLYVFYPWSKYGKRKKAFHWHFINIFYNSYSISRDGIEVAHAMVPFNPHSDRIKRAPYSIVRMWGLACTILLGTTIANADLADRNQSFAPVEGRLTFFLNTYFHVFEEASCRKACYAIASGIWRKLELIITFFSCFFVNCKQ